MAKVRQDAWSHEDDLLLAETVLRHIREGSTQLRAFDEVGDALNRTSAACGFRWNAEVRQKYDQAIDIAKKQRKEKKRAEAREQTNSPAPSFYKETPSPTTHQETSVESHNEVPVQVMQKPEEPSINLKDVIQYLKNLQVNMNSSKQDRSKLGKFEQENQQLREENDRLQKNCLQLQAQMETMQDDYQALIQIMDRARKMIVFDEDGNYAKPQFRMERNGNLEQVAR
ncbi:RsfA family transcriptional regulator [Thalassobacillus hwangdonensis]|uniref:RsfA family transcriptional regulator n=1 Tax=Thalassobacillus hwangdonensis TaxID=546108 RepID=A0ABW3KZ90_9BACI